jgi:hypothetical protein
VDLSVRRSKTKVWSMVGTLRKRFELKAFIGFADSQTTYRRLARFTVLWGCMFRHGNSRFTTSDIMGSL